MGRLVGDGRAIAGRSTALTEVGGRAHRTGSASFTLDPDEALGLGFQLR